MNSEQIWVLIFFTNWIWNEIDPTYICLIAIPTWNAKKIYKFIFLNFLTSISPVLNTDNGLLYMCFTLHYSRTYILLICSYFTFTYMLFYKILYFEKEDGNTLMETQAWVADELMGKEDFLSRDDESNLR